jgi:hypothetical protein
MAEEAASMAAQVMLSSNHRHIQNKVQSDQREAATKRKYERKLMISAMFQLALPQFKALLLIGSNSQDTIYRHSSAVDIAEPG